MISVDIVICTYNRSGELAQTLSGLLSLRSPDQVEWRVLVVNNNCTDDTDDVIGRFGDAFAGRLHKVSEPTPGLCHARNAAIAASQADVVAFLDDDVDIEPQWLEWLCRAFEEESCAVVGGRAELRFPGERPTWIGYEEELMLSRVNRGPVRRLCGPEEIYGLNMAIRRSWFQRLGLFRADLGRVGASLISGDETELLRRITVNGGTIIYEPNAALWHRVAMTRLDKRWFLRRFYWGVRSGMRVNGASRSEALGRLPAGAGAMVRASAAYLWRGLRNGWESPEAYERMRWVMDTRAIVDESLYALLAPSST
jgi:glycosyltransferase involved in cell wall biosynthesis